jgi:hypothetical protein
MDDDKSREGAVETIQQLTDDIQAEGLADLRLCAHLALVRARVSHLGRAHFECPLIGSVRVQGLEALVVGVREDTDCQDVKVPLADPGHGSVAQVSDSAVKIRALPHCRRHLAPGRIVEVRL